MLTVTIPLIPTAIALVILLCSIVAYAEDQGDITDGFVIIGLTLIVFFVSYGVNAMFQYGFGG